VLEGRFIVTDERPLATVSTKMLDCDKALLLRVLEQPQTLECACR
jgi:hypothetical protein